MTDKPVTITDPEYLRQQLHAAIESEIYAYRERTMFWEETGGVTEEIARLATRRAMEVRDHHLDQLRQRLDIAALGLGGPPAPDYATAWTELTGYVLEAVHDGGIINPTELNDYMRELRHKANAPTRAWFNTLLRERDEEDQP